MEKKKTFYRYIPSFLVKRDLEFCPGSKRRSSSKPRESRRISCTGDTCPMEWKCCCCWYNNLGCSQCSTFGTRKLCSRDRRSDWGPGLWTFRRRVRSSTSNCPVNGQKIRKFFKKKFIKKKKSKRTMLFFSRLWRWLWHFRKFLDAELEFKLLTFLFMLSSRSMSLPILSCSPLLIASFFWITFFLSQRQKM